MPVIGAAAWRGLALLERGEERPHELAGRSGKHVQRLPSEHREALAVEQARPAAHRNIEIEKRAPCRRPDASAALQPAAERGLDRASFAVETDIEITMAPARQPVERDVG